MQDLINQIVEERKKATDAKASKEEKARIYGTLLEFLGSAFEQVIKELKQDGTVEVKNFPKVQEIKGDVEVKGLPSIMLSLEKIKSLLKSLDKEIVFPKTQQVVVENFPKPQDIVFPEYPKQIKVDAVSMPKYVQDLLTDIKKTLQTLKLDPQINVESAKPSDVVIDTKSLEKALKSILLRLEEIEITPVVNIDTNSVVKANEQVEEAIKNLKFPVPNFKSSWAHSLSMRAEDLQADYGYTSNDPDNPDYIDVYDEDGSKWRREFTYGTVGGQKVVTSKSKWSRV